MIEFPLFTVGDAGPEVENIQRRLLCPDIDGIYTEELAVRVRGFQLVHHLPLTGEVDEMTYGLLLGDAQ